MALITSGSGQMQVSYAELSDAAAEYRLRVDFKCAGALLL